jgi:lipopolysaccharide/colanic/teichoic acid biosynthesis glycosyltransferase
MKRVSPGPAFYTQEREGQGSTRIRVPKLRTMHVNAESLLLEHLSENAEARREWQEHFKLKEDPRIVPGIGRLLRRTSLDELPQLWSVLKGEMSLVGPRPFPCYHLDEFDAGFRALRGRVPPGLTGLWQVSGRSNGDLKVQEAMDTYYIRNWSLWLDLHILARTIHAVLFGKGAY